MTVIESQVMITPRGIRTIQTKGETMDSPKSKNILNEKEQDLLLESLREKITKLEQEKNEIEHKINDARKLIEKICENLRKNESD